MRKTLLLALSVFILLAAVVAMTSPTHAATCEQVAVTRGSPPVTAESVTIVMHQRSAGEVAVNRSKIQDICPAYTQAAVNDLRYRSYNDRGYRYSRVLPTDTVIRLDTRTGRVYSPLRR